MSDTVQLAAAATAPGRHDRARVRAQHKYSPLIELDIGWDVGLAAADEPFAW